MKKCQSSGQFARGEHLWIGQYILWVDLAVKNAENERIRAVWVSQRRARRRRSPSQWRSRASSTQWQHARTKVYRI